MNEAPESARRVGDPFAVPPEAARGADTPHGTSRRRGDSGLGDPGQAPDILRVVPASETRERAEEDSRAREEVLARELLEDSGWLPLRGLRVAAAWTLAALAAVVGFFALAQATRVAADLARLPAAARWPVFVGALLFGGVLVCVVARLLWMALRFARAPRVAVGALAALRERAGLQDLVARRQAQARDILVGHLRGFPLDRAGTRALAAAGVTDAEIARLVPMRERLLDAARPAAPGEWLAEFSSGFQKVLDEAATRRIRQYARRVAAGTAISPVAMVDQMIVLYACAAMVKDLMCLYRLRPAFGQTALIMARGIVHAYLSGLFGEAAEKAMDGIAEAAGDTVDILGGSLGRLAGAKAAEAGLNGLLLLRLGHRAMAMMQPCRRTP